MSSDLQISASESWYSYVPPIQGAIPQSLSSIPQAAVAAIPVALSFDQTIQGKSRLYQQDTHVALKVGINMAVSVVSLVVRDALRALQISYLTNHYVWEPSHSVEEYLLFTKSGTDTTLGLGVDGARAVDGNRVALYVEKFNLKKSINFLEQSAKETAIKTISEKPNLKDLDTARMISAAQAQLQSKIAATMQSKHDQLRIKLNFLQRMKEDWLTTERAAKAAEQVHRAAMKNVANELPAVVEAHSAASGIPAAVAQVDFKATVNEFPEEVLVEAPTNAAKAFRFNPMIEYSDGATGNLLSSTEGDSELCYSEGLSEKGLTTLIRRLLGLKTEEKVTTGHIGTVIGQLKKEIEEARIDMHMEKSVGLPEANSNAHGASAKDYTTRLAKIYEKKQELDAAQTRLTEVEGQLAGKDTVPDSKLGTFLQAVEWGFNLLRLGSFLHDQANYNSRLEGLEKAYKKQTKA